MSIDLSQYSDTVRAFNGNEQRATVFLDRYALKDSAGLPVESVPESMWGRVAVAMARKDAAGIPDSDQYNRFFNLLRDFKFVPGGRILAGAGTGSEVTFYNCYVIPVETKARRQNRALLRDNPHVQPDDLPSEWLDSDPGNDSREAIFDTIGLMVDIMSRGGGVGINWSVLRPKGAYLQRVNGTSSGPIGWMDVASKAVGEVEQGGSRRGAAMFMLDDWHPDLLDFINAKRDFSRITNANVSVAVSDDFMQAVRDDREWTFHFPDTSDPSYDTEWDGDIGAWLDKGLPVKFYETVKARDLWRKLAEAAHASGEPGVVFLDRYNKLSTGQGVERLISVNPCGEQGLGPYSVCNLGAMNLAAYIDDEGGASWPAFDWDSFAVDVRTAVEFLDRAIDVNFYFLPENERVQKDLRRIGLSVMGLADALIRLGLTYGSPDAVEFTEKVFRTMKDEAIHASAKLAEELGPAPAWDYTKFSRPYLSEHGSRVHPTESCPAFRHGLRNMFLLTQAPTGTTSILAGVNSGIEPYFAFHYTRKDRTGEHVVFAPVLDQIGYDGSWTADYLVTSKDVTVEEHIAMQAAVQRFVDSSVSKTINAPADQTVEEVEKAYTLAYESGLKGLAYYRDGSRDVQVLNHDKEGPTQGEIEAARMAADLVIENATLKLRIKELESDEFKRPRILHGTTHKVETRMGTAYVTVNRDADGVPVEVFLNVGKSGSDIMELGEAIGRLISLALRHGATPGGVANQLEGIGGARSFNVSLPHAVGNVLTQLNADNLEITVPQGVFDETGQDVLPDDWVAPRAKTKPAGTACQQCGSMAVVREEGCQKCHACGWSAC